MSAAIQSGKLAAVVLPKPGAPPDSVAPGRSMAAEFEKRFVLVTRDTVDQVLQRYPELF